MAEMLTPNGLVVGLIPDELLKAKEKSEQKQEDAPADKAEGKRTGRQKADK